jgi:hypothetical protein
VPEVKDERKTVTEEKHKKILVRDTTAERKQKGTKKSLTVQLSENGSAQLKPFGELMETLIQSSHLVFATESEESINLLEFVQDHRRSKSVVPLNSGTRDLFEKVLDSIDCSNLYSLVFPSYLSTANSS